MHAIKDRVSEKLSRFFSDSPSRNLDQQPQARPCIEDEKYRSSLFSFVLPSLSFYRSTSNSPQLIPHESHSFSWRSKSFSVKDIPLDRHIEHENDFENNGIPSPHEGDHGHGSLTKLSFVKKQHINALVDNGDPSSTRSIDNASKVFEDAAEKFTFEKSMLNLIDDSLFISPDLYEFFESSLPNIVKGCQWTLLYSTARHGISLRTLIRKSTNVSGPFLLITGDKKGAIFGGLLECPLKPTAKRMYQGTNQTFIFTTLYGEPRLFRPTGVNRYFYLCLNDLLAFGGGENFALRLDEDLLTGSSGACETFGSSCLAHDQEFELKNVELWGFTHASRYLS